MQFGGGGYRYPGTALCAVFTGVAVVSVVGIAHVSHLSLRGTVTLFLTLEGTVLLASAFTPTGLTPPQGGALSRIRWFVAQEGGVPVKFSQPLFYGGLLALFLSTAIGALAPASQRQPKDVAVYPLRTIGDGQPQPIGMAVYRVDVSRQDVMWWRPGIADSPERLLNCAVRDAENWRCEAVVATEPSIVTMQAGRFEETVLSMHLKDRGVTREAWEEAQQQRRLR
jgi:hypothetical protein